MAEFTLPLGTLEQLPYLSAVLTEGLRMSPAIASRSARVAPDKELFYENWRVPAVTPVGMTALLLHVDEKLFPDPMLFYPDRWTDVAVQRYEKHLAPVGNGTRICIGMQ